MILGKGYLILVAVLAMLIVAPAHADTDKRVALIIGNDAYKSLPRLNNGANDARAMERSLKALGFETILKVNAGRREMNGAIAEFGGKLSSGAVGLFYYAGHGIQADGRNFLVPVDAQLETEVDLDSDGIDADRVLKSMEGAHNRLNIVVLDACRDNPLPKKGRSAARGLAVVGNTPGGSLVAYAAGPNQQAQDGEAGSNGIYAAALLEALAVPGLKVEDVFKRTADVVRTKTGGKQQPWQLSSVSGDYYFRAPIAKAEAVAPVSSGGADKEAMFWSSIQGSNDLSMFEAYLSQFPTGTFVAIAKAKIETLKGANTAALSPGAAPKPEPVLEALDREMVAGRKASVRESPDSRAKVISSLAEGDVVHVTGKVQGANWYAVARKGRDQSYVVMETLEESGTYKARKERDAQAATDEEKHRQQAAAEESKQQAAKTAVEDEKRRQQQASLTARPNQPELENTLYMDLSGGRVVIQMRPDLAPRHVARVKDLVRRGFYDGLPFHRVISGFMAQGGDPTGTGTGGSGQKISAEFSPEHHVRGIVSMARSSSPDSADSQFFIMLGTAPSLDGRYSVWGRVVQGMDLVDAIPKGSESDNGMVSNPGKIIRMRIAADGS
jgi:cyclophilin family peptidyl-prolyl cis-trans isomerase/uncharacterized caspase-like protein